MKEEQKNYYLISWIEKKKKRKSIEDIRIKKKIWIKIKKCIYKKNWKMLKIKKKKMIIK